MYMYVQVQSSCLFMKTKFLNGVTALLVLGALVDVRVDSRRLRVADVNEVDKIEHQRILAELDEVHQLRERLLQDCEAPHHYPAQPISKSQGCFSTSNCTLLTCKATALSTLQGSSHGMCSKEAKPCMIMTYSCATHIPLVAMVKSCTFSICRGVCACS